MSRGDIWTDERKDEVRRLWAEGRSASQIANVLGATRNAVIGIIHRNKDWEAGARLPVKRGPRKPRQPKPKQSAAVRVYGRHGSSIAPKPLPARPAEVPTEGTATLIELGAGQCRFPMWGDRFDLATSLYCGRPRNGDDTPYCVHHRRLCTQPLSNSRIAKKTPEVEAA